MAKYRKIHQTLDRNGMALVVVLWSFEWQEYQVCCLADGSTYPTDDREDAYNQRDYLLNFYYSKG